LDKNVSEAYAAYRKLFSERLAAVGAVHIETIQPPAQIGQFDSEIGIDRWNHDGSSFSISRGCAKYSATGKGFDEFVIESGRNEALAFELLSFVIYFHLTFRPVLATDVLEIGKGTVNETRYSHIYISVPFFWPGDVNFLDTSVGKYYLNWLMPVVAEEAEFMKRTGSEEFERRLNQSGYGFFDLRDRLDYLEQQ
jgi:Suppressor of fused protein (SUFU)